MNQTANPSGQREQPPLPIPVDEDGREAVIYFPDSDAADAAMDRKTVEEALALIGAWSHIDWDEMADALDRTRHESTQRPRSTICEAVSVGYRPADGLPSIV